MPDIEFQFDASNFITKLDSIEGRVTTGLKRAAIYLLSESAKTIRDGGDSWAAFKRPPKRPHQLLYDTGRLIGSLAPGGAMNIFDIAEGGTSITVGSNLAYARAQSMGDPAHDLPARPFLFVNSQRAQKMASIIQTYINEA